MAIAWGAIETAVKAWLSTATGIDQARIVFPHQKSPGLDQGSFLSILFDGPAPIGAIDELRYPYDAGQANGAEVQTTVVGQREFTVSVQAYTIQEIGAGTAKELLSQARTRLSTTSQQLAFNAVGAAFVDASKVDLLAELGPLGQGRAHMDVRFRAVDSVVDPEGYIATVTISPPGSLS